MTSKQKSPILPLTQRKSLTDLDHKDLSSMSLIVSKKEASPCIIEKCMKSIYRDIMLKSETTLNSPKVLLKKIREIVIRKEDIIIIFDVENLHYQ